MGRFGRHRKLRTGRRSAAGIAYLVTFSTHDRDPLFIDLILGRSVVQSMRFSDGRGWTETWAFVVMPDHVHWLLLLDGDRSLSQVIGSVKRFSAKRINHLRCCAGPVWQKGFYDHAMRREENVELAARYVVRNPIRAGLVGRVGDYPLWDVIWLG